MIAASAHWERVPSEKNPMLRSMIAYRPLALATGLALLAACAETTPPVCVSPVVTAADGPQLAGAWYQVYFETDTTEINARG